MFRSVRSQQQSGLHDPDQSSRPALHGGQEGAEGARSAAGMESGRSLCLDRRAGGQARPRPRRSRMPGIREGLQGQARRPRGRLRRRPHACRGGQALRGDRRSARPADFLCRAALCRQHHRSRHREVLRRHAGAHHRGVAASAVLHARTQPHRRRRARQAAMADPALGHYRPWIEDIRKDKPYPARRSRRAIVPREIRHRLLAPGTGCSTRPWRRCASRSAASRCRSSRR